MPRMRKTYITSLLFLMLLPLHLFAQTQDMKDATTPHLKVLPKGVHVEYEEDSALTPRVKVKMDDADRLRMDNLRLKQQLIDSQLQTLFQVWLQDPKVASMSKLSKGLKDELQANANDAYKKYKLKPEEYDLDLEHGSFVPKAKEK